MEMFWNVLWTVLAWVKTLLLRTPSMNRSFIILSSGRSGSTMLVQLLNCHPAILCHSELLNRDDLKWYGLIREGRLCVSSHRLIKYTMAQLVPWKPWLPYTGFKLFNEQIKFCRLSFTNLLNALHDPPVIVLYRENLLETYTSLEIAFQTGEWYSETKMNQVSVEIDWEKFQEYAVTERERWRNSMQVLSTHQKVVFISYSELTDRKEERMRKIFTFLNVDSSVETFAVSVKQNALPLDKKISNYQEVMSKLESSDVCLVLSSDWLQENMQ